MSTEYEKAAGINATAITAGMVSMAHMHHVLTGGPRADSPAMRLGRHAHMSVLEPERGKRSHGVWTGKTKRGGEWESCLSSASNPDYIVTPDEHAELSEMSAAVWRCGHAVRLLTGCEFERPVYWTGPRYGLGKCRVDAMQASGAVLVDYKTTRKPGVDAFMRTAWNLAYHVRMGWYAHGIEIATGTRPDVWLIVQEQSAPFDCWVCHMPAAIVEEGEKTAIDIAARYRCACEAGVWPGVASDVVQFAVPSFAMKDMVDMGGDDIMEDKG